jgi:hypothetical protein
MLRWIALLLVSSAFASEPKPGAAPVKVTVVATTPAAAYRWVGSGNGPVPCMGAQCEHYFLQVQEGYPTADIVLRLVMPDSRIVVVGCYAKEVLGVNYAIQLVNGSDADVPIRRVCGAPPPGVLTDAVFNGNDVRLTVPGTTKTGQPLTEMYHIKGFLEPITDVSSSGEKSGLDSFVTTIPIGAQVFLDGQRVGTSPTQVKIPSTGTAHLFTVKKDGYLTGEQKVKADSEQTRFEFVLKPKD